MKERRFKCILKSDVIINVKSATVGNNETLDFIPGSCFLGIVASGNNYEMFGNANAYRIFHSGELIFGDAHPSESDKRSLKVPFAWQKPKDKSRKELYVHNEIPDFSKVIDLQLKPMKRGFYTFENRRAKQIEVETSYAIKSAYDREKRHSKDSAMYGYESICCGTEMVFSIFIADSFDLALANEVVDKLCGSNRHIGRSRTAQFGLVDISPIDEDWNEVPNFEHIEDESRLVIYAESRLILLDENNLPKTQLSINNDLIHFGLIRGQIDFSHSLIRTFQYAPWNYKRQSFDTDRYGIEKGSVIVIENASGDVPMFVGAYKNEGFGKVLINPDFLEAYPDGKVKYNIVAKKDIKIRHNFDDLCRIAQGEISQLRKISDDDFYSFLADQKEDKLQLDAILSIVEDSIYDAEQRHLFKNFSSSQFGTIRSYAMVSQSDVEVRDQIISYISTDKRKANWQGDRHDWIVGFMDTIQNNVFLNGIERKNSLRLAIINLTAEMAKKCSVK